MCRGRRFEERRVRETKERKEAKPTGLLAMFGRIFGSAHSTRNQDTRNRAERGRRVVTSFLFCLSRKLFLTTVGYVGVPRERMEEGRPCPSVGGLRALAVFHE